MIEIYQAYGNYETMMELTEAMIADAIRAMRGQGSGVRGQGEGWGLTEAPKSPNLQISAALNP